MQAPGPAADVLEVMGTTRTVGSGCDSHDHRARSGPTLGLQPGPHYSRPHDDRDARAVGRNAQWAGHPKVPGPLRRDEIEEGLSP